MGRAVLGPQRGTPLGATGPGCGRILLPSPLASNHENDLGAVSSGQPIRVSP